MAGAPGRGGAGRAPPPSPRLCPSPRAQANLGFNVLIVVLLKFGGSTVLWLALTVQVPAAALCFALPFMPASAPVTWQSGVGLLVIMAGLIVYRFWPLLRGALVTAGVLAPLPEAGDAEDGGGKA